MKRNLEQMARERYDLVVVGGGISGAAVAWDAALRGLSVALVEKKDFGAATSAATSKLAHGGLRYLKNLEFDLVRESLMERRLLEKIAPHLVYPMPFIVPTYKGSSNNRLMLIPGMILYDVLSYDKGWLEDPDRRMPHFRYLSKEKVVELEPGVEKNGLTGGVMYYDAQMRSPDRLTLAFIQSAASRGARLANYAEATGFVMEENVVRGVKVRDAIEGGEHEIRGRVTVNCSGPWADIVLGLTGKPASKHVLRSQGIHVVTRRIIGDHALVLLTPGGRHYFIIPWRGETLIGTTDTKYEGDPDRYVVSEEAVADFLDEINGSYPAANLKREDVNYAYGGLRPIVEKDTQVDVYKASRKYEIYDHADGDNIGGLLTVIGGKYTTSRHLGEQIVDAACRKIGRNVGKTKTKEVPLTGGNTGNFAPFVEEIKKAAPDGVSAECAEYLAGHYGTLTHELFALCRQDPSLAEPVGDTRVDIAAQIVFAARHEMARTVLDVLQRRTGIGTIGHPGEAVVGKVADIMASELGWDDETRARQFKAANDHLAVDGVGVPSV